MIFEMLEPKVVADLLLTKKENVFARIGRNNITIRYDIIKEKPHHSSSAYDDIVEISFHSRKKYRNIDSTFNPVTDERYINMIIKFSIDVMNCIMEHPIYKTLWFFSYMSEEKMNIGDSVTLDDGRSGIVKNISGSQGRYRITVEKCEK